MQNSASIIGYPQLLTINNKNEYAELLQVFKVLFEQNDHAENTKKALVSDINKFGAWFESKNGEKFCFQNVTPLDIISFRDDMKAKYKPATVNRALTNVRVLLQTAVDEGIIEENPAKKVKALKLQKLAPKGLTQEEARRLLRKLQHPKLGKKRERGHIAKHFAIVQLMLGAGLRVSEVVSLKLGDVELSERKGHVTVRDSKGSKTREVPLSKSVRDALSEHLNYYRASESGDSLFISERGKPKGKQITIAGISKLIRFYGDQAGIPKLSPHQLRHTFAFNYLTQTGNDLVGLQQILGHSTITVTAGYAQNRLSDLQSKVEELSV